MIKQRVVYLLRQHRKGLLTKEEELELLDLIRKDSEESLVVEAMIEDAESEVFQYSGNIDRLKEMAEKIVTIDRPIAKQKQLGLLKHIHFQRRWGWAASAVAILLIGIGTYFFINRTNEKPTISAVHYKGDVQPGHNGAVLHLSNGDTIVLDSAEDGTVATQGSIQAVKLNGALKYTGQTSELLYNTVSTDRGRQWHLTLPDGTKVWLNSASSIRYPLSFPGKERVVEITGEAYMEVVHNTNQPFKVKAGNQVAEDIGTAFNINAYGDEQEIKTTLLEGSIKVFAHAGTRIIKPGQQTIVHAIGSGITVNSNVNVENVIAWKNGFFAFQDADIKAVMHQLSRWYNVDVKYEGAISNEEFNGKIGQGLTLAQVLKILEKTGVHFKIEEDKRILILP